MKRLFSVAAVVCALASVCVSRAGDQATVDATTLRGKIMCGYQGWFRCPGDAANLGWVHWSRTPKRLAPETLTFEMWPDMREYSKAERFPAPGFTYPDGQPAELFSSDNAATVLRHFEWMRDGGLDGAWLQHFVVDLPGGRGERRYASRRSVMEHVRSAATKTGRVWALTYDISGMSADRVFEVLTADWKRLVDGKVIADSRYLRHGGKPVVQVFGYYFGIEHSAMTADLANRLSDFFQAPGPYAAFLVGGGDWNWRRNPGPEGLEVFRRLGAYCPWNVGHAIRDKDGVQHAATHYWAEDKRDCDARGALWIPVIYPGFSWDNLKQSPPGGTNIARRGGKFLWEQFHELGKMGVDSVFVAMFDEVDEGTAIFKVMNTPPSQAHFVGYEGLPGDWYLRLVGEGGRLLRQHLPVPQEIPIKP